MDLPRLLAIDDVHLIAPHGVQESLVDLYVNLLGFDQMPGRTAELACTSLVLRGYPRSGPRLVIELAEGQAEKPMRRRALIQVGPLEPCAKALAERRVAFEWCSGWFHFDRRLGVLDPGGNWIELVSSHPF